LLAGPPCLGQRIFARGFQQALPKKDEGICAVLFALFRSKPHENCSHHDTPDGKPALMLTAAWLCYAAGTKWGTRRYLDMNYSGRSERSDMNAHGKTFSLRIRSIEPAPMWMLSPNEVNEHVRFTSADIARKPPV